LTAGAVAGRLHRLAAAAGPAPRVRDLRERGG
jgi:hypothetical protein